MHLNHTFFFLFLCFQILAIQRWVIRQLPGNLSFILRLLALPATESDENCSRAPGTKFCLKNHRSVRILMGAFPLVMGDGWHVTLRLS